MVDQLRQAGADGRLTVDELEERMGLAFAAKTYGELDALIEDLPAARFLEPHREPQLAVRRDRYAVARPPRHSPPPAALLAVMTTVIAVGVATAHPWIIPMAAFVIFRIWGGRRVGRRFH